MFPFYLIKQRSVNLDQKVNDKENATGGYHVPKPVRFLFPD